MPEMTATNLSEAILAYNIDGSPRALQIAERRSRQGLGHDAARAQQQQNHRHKHRVDRQEEDTSSSSSSRTAVLERSPALVLNSDYQPLSYTPLSVWSWQEAVKAVFLGRVVVVAEYSECVIRSANQCINAPSVIALRSYQQRNLGKHPHFTRRNVYIRDLFTCQYCARQYRPSQLTYDHVTPRSKGGATSWDNVVTACTACNNKKGDLSAAVFANKYGHKLRTRPYAPSHGELAGKARRLPLYRQYHETWGAYVSDAHGAKMSSQRSRGGARPS